MGSKINARNLRVALVGMMDGGQGPLSPRRSNMLGVALLKTFCDARPELSGSPEITVLDESTSIKPAALARKILRRNPDVAGFSLRECNYRLSAKTAKLLRAKKPCIKIVLGGYEAWARTEEMLRMFDADCAVAGEGELAFAELLLAWKEGRTAQGIPGTACLKNGKTVFGPPRDPMNLEEGVSPYICGFYPTRDIPYDFMTLETSRGCTNNCTWCSWPHTNRVRLFPLEKVEKEIAFVCSLPEHCAVAFADSNIFLSPERAAGILRAIHRYDPEQKRQWWLNSYLGHITPEIAKLCNHRRFEIACGVETTNSAVLKANHRYHNPEAEARGAKLLARYAPDAYVCAQMICGLPGDTLAGLCRSIDDVFRMGFSYMLFFQLHVLPGTYLYKNAGTLGIKFAQESPFGILEAPGFPAKDMRRAHYVIHTVAALMKDARCREALLSHALAGGSISSAALALSTEFSRAGFTLASIFSMKPPALQLTPLDDTTVGRLPAKLDDIITCWRKTLLRGPDTSKTGCHALRPAKNSR
jgi:hypothetical protein